MNIRIIPASWTPYLLALLRIVTGLLFLEHGASKLFNFPVPGPADLPYGLLLFTGLMETVGGALITTGFLTRPVAFVLSGYMAAAYFIAHLPRGFFPVVNQGEGAILFCFVFLYLAVAGAGALAIDKD